MTHQNVNNLVLKLRQQFSENNVNIPDELKILKAWLVWETTEIQPNGKFNKIPVYPTTGRRRGESKACQRI
jgi:primase-polymerase (primpol)-like protein